MPAPYDYRIPEPTANFMTGVQQAYGLVGLKQEQELRQLQIEQAKQAAEAKAQLQADMAMVAGNPTPAALSKMMVKYPQLSEQFKRSYDVLNEEQKQGRLGQATQVFAALEAGNPEVAQQVLRQQAEAARNSGMEQDAKTAETIAELVKLHPDTAKTSTGLFLAHAMGPDKFAETFTKLQGERRAQALEPSQLSESQARAQKAAVDAKFAESDAVLEQQKKGWDITKIQEDIKIAKENARIAAINAQISREGNGLKKQELSLKLEEMKLKRDEAVREKVATVESARATMDNLLNTADRILQTPIGVVESATGPLSSRLPTMSQDVADFEALIETMGSQAFLSQIPAMKGTGNLTEREGDKLQAGLQNLSLKQSPKRLIENVREVQRLILKGRKGIAAKHGMPDNIPDTPAVAPSPDEVEALVRKYGGASGSY
jgi:hypothetical protein